MSRFEKTESNSNSSKNEKAVQHPTDWWHENITNPFCNALIVEPANAITCTFDTFTHQKEVHRLTPSPVPQTSDFGTTVCQGAASAVGGVLPYALAGKFAGSGLRFLGARLEVEGALAKFAQSDRAAQIIGAGLYDGMRETRAGETHLRNGAAGAVNFTILEFIGGKGKCPFDRIFDRFMTGGVATIASAYVARPDLFPMAGSVKSSDVNFNRQFFAGAILNVLLPGTQHGVRKACDAMSLKLGSGIPIDRFVRSKEPSFANAFSSPNDLKLLDANRWATVQPNAEVNSYHAGKDLVTLKDSGNFKALRHELQHRNDARAKISEPGFLRAAGLLSKDKEQAWRVYRSVRQAQEVRAELANYHDTGLKTYAETVRNLKESIPSSSATHGDTYETLWRKEFQRFERTGGKFRPEVDFSSDFGFKMLHKESDLLYEQLRPKHSNVSSTLQQIVKRYDVPVPQLALALKHVNEFLNPSVVHPVDVDADKLAMQTLRLIGNPEKVSQGKHPTCAPASLEYYTYLKHPENATDLLSQVVRMNQFECLDGSPIVVNGLNVVPEKYWNRSFANQLFQNTAVNVHWQRKRDLTPWLSSDDNVNLKIRPGLTRYQRQWSNQMNESPYRLLDYSKFPPVPIHDRLPEHRNDPSSPLMTLNAVEDIHHQINGTTRGGILLSERFDNAVELADVLRERESRAQLPVLAWLDTRQPLLAHGAGEPSAGGGHAVVIKSYDSKSKRVSIFNPWGEMLHGVGIKDLFQATQDYDPSIVADRKK